MALFPSDDPAIPLATRRRLAPLVASHASSFIDNVKRNAPTAGASQGRDVWGRNKFSATWEFNLGIDDIELIMSFWAMYKVSGFFGYDFEFITVGSPGYRAPEALGIGNGVITTFTVAAKQISNITVYDNGVSTAAWTLSIGTGPQGEDRIIFTAAPVAGHILTIAYKGRHRYFLEIPSPPAKGNTEWNRQRVSFPVLEKF
jgi:hypothetical protein